MKIINFAHPITEEQRKQISELCQDSIAEIIDVPTQFNFQKSFVEQVQKLISSIKLSSKAWQTDSLLINLPSFNIITAVLLTELHGRMGYFPSIIRLRPVEGALPPKFEVAEILKLQELRDVARHKR